ncbi:MAG: peptidylprolyl isomerase [Candidatus Aenigmatarchaeota archaeon]|nr:peptidylprolyl isomerase [Candidatus Aenigmarchaeota archaeon]
MQIGDFIRVDYVGRLKDTNEIFDLTLEEVAKKEGIYDEKRKYKPACIILGEGMILKALEDFLLSMNVGEKKLVTISHENAFGKRKPELVRSFPLDFFKKEGVEPKPGLIVNISGFLGRIQTIGSGRVMVDFNHPLAGRDLIYEIEIKEKIDDPLEKLRFILEIFDLDAKSKINEKETTIEIENNSIEIKTKRNVVYLIKKYLKVERVIFLESF